MKKSLLSIFIVCGLLTALSVQQAKAQADVGLRAGVNFSNYNDLPDGFEPDSRTGYMVGGYVDFSVPMSPFSIQPEILYTQKGYEQGGVTLKSDYLEVPVLAKFSFLPGPIQPHIYLGPYAGFALNSEASGGGVSIDTEDAQTDFGGIIGGGADINAGVTKFNIGIRYGFGLVDAYEGGQGKNSVLSIVAGISL